MTLSKGGHQAVNRSSIQEAMGETDHDETLLAKT